MNQKLDLVRSRIRAIPDFPKPGILFRDITPLLGDPLAFSATIELLAEAVADLAPDTLVAIESRGFLFGAPLALRLGASLVPVRKPGKLPYKTRRAEYALEYGTDTLEMHEDAIRPGARALVIDDLIATGGTAKATETLVTEAGGVLINHAFVVELDALGGRARLEPTPVRSVLRY